MKPKIIEETFTPLTIYFPLVYKEALIYADEKEEREQFKRGLEKLLGVKLKLKVQKNPKYGNPDVGDWIIDLK